MTRDREHNLRRLCELRNAARLSHVDYPAPKKWLDPVAVANALHDVEQAVLEKARRQPPDPRFTDGRALAAARDAVLTGMGYHKCYRLLDPLPIHKPAALGAMTGHEPTHDIR